MPLSSSTSLHVRGKCCTFHSAAIIWQLWFQKPFAFKKAYEELIRYDDLLFPKVQTGATNCKAKAHRTPAVLAQTVWIYLPNLLNLVSGLFIIPLSGLCLLSSLEMYFYLIQFYFCVCEALRSFLTYSWSNQTINYPIDRWLIGNYFKKN